MDNETKQQTDNVEGGSMTLEELLRTKVKSQNKDEKEIEITPEFRISVQEIKGDSIHFIIHPQDHNGETLDFVVKGNALIPLVSKIVAFPGITTQDMPADWILFGAIGKLEDVIVSGFTKKGGILYTASSVADGADALWLAEKFKQRLLNQG